VSADTSVVDAHRCGKFVTHGAIGPFLPINFGVVPGALSLLDCLAPCSVRLRTQLRLCAGRSADLRLKARYEVRRSHL
jgi:hypothetical protein